MKLNKKKWTVVVLGAILLILILLNPSISEFRNFARNPCDPKGTVYKRTANYFIFSTYVKQWQNGDDEDHIDEYSGRYIGIIYLF